MYIQVNIVKIYACKKAIRNSRPITATKPATGTTPNIPSGMTNPPMTFNNVCPAIILANNLTLRLNGRVKYEITSITMISGERTIGTPAGKKNEKNLKPCFMNAMNVTMRKIATAMVSVTAMWLVKVKLYGTIPIKFPKRTNIKIEKISGK